MVCVLCIIPFGIIIGVGLTSGGGIYSWLLWLGLLFIVISLSIYAYYYFAKKRCEDKEQCLLPGL